MIKIIFVLKSFANTAGTERITADKINYLAKTGKYEIMLLTYEQGDHSFAYPLDESITFVDLKAKFYMPSNASTIQKITYKKKQLKTLEKNFKQEIKRFSPDIVVTNTYSTIATPSMKRVIKKQGCKWIVESHTIYDDVFKRQNSGKLINRLIGRYMEHNLQSALKSCDVMTAITKEDKKRWDKIGFNTKVITNFVTSYPETIKQHKRNNKIIVAGRYDSQKGYDLLVKAWELIHKRYSDWTIDIYGTGEVYRELISNMIKQCGLESSIILHDAVDNIYEKYQESDIFILPSRFEAFGLVLVEAMACGLPCISFDCPSGPREIIRHNEDGLLVENGNVKALAKAIAYMIDNPEKAKSLAEKARLNVKRFDKESVMNTTMEMYDRLMAMQSAI